MEFGPIANDSAALARAKAEAFAVMRSAIQDSATCSAYVDVAEDIRPDRIGAIAPLSRGRLADWGADTRGPNRITTGDVRLVLRSSGSSGTIRTLRHSAAFNDQVEFLGGRGVAMDGLSRNPLVVNALAAGDMFGGFGFAEAALARRGAGVLPAGSSMRLDLLAGLMRDEVAEAIVGVPGHLGRLVSQHPEAFDAVRVAYYLGDRPRPELRRVFQDRKIALRSFALSTTETGPIGFQCSALSGDDHHVHEDLVHVEVVGEGGRPQRDGLAGRVLVTPLVDSGLAMLRYQVGDMGVLLGPGCRCGSVAPVLRLGGRDGTSVNVRGTLITESMVRTSLGMLSDDLQVGVIEGAEAFRLSVRITPGTRQGLPDVESAFRTEPTLQKLVLTPGFEGVELAVGGPPVLDGRGKQPFFFRGGID